MSLIFHVPYINSNLQRKLTSKCCSFQTIPDLFVGKCVFSTVQGTVFRLFSEYLFTSLCCLYIWQFPMLSSSGTQGPLVSLTPLDVAIPSLGWFIQMTFDHPQVSARKLKKKCLVIVTIKNLRKTILSEDSAPLQEEGKTCGTKADFPC